MLHTKQRLALRVIQNVTFIGEPDDKVLHTDFEGGVERCIITHIPFKTKDEGKAVSLVKPFIYSEVSRCGFVKHLDTASQKLSVIDKSGQWLINYQFCVVYSQKMKKTAYVESFVSADMIHAASLSDNLVLSDKAACQVLTEIFR